MWQIDPTPFVVRQCTANSISPLSYWADYPYTFESEAGPLPIAQIDPARLIPAPLSVGCMLSNRSVCRLNGKAIRTVWEHRRALPEHVWIPGMETLSHTGTRVSSLALDGLRLRNPYGVSCMFYLCWTEGDVRWGITPVGYDRGPTFMRLVLEI